MDGDLGLSASVQLFSAWSQTSHDQLSRLYIVAKDPIATMNQTNAIYHIPCRSHTGHGPCPKSYIGRMSTSIHERLTHHESSVRHSKNDSSLFMHISSAQGEHVIDYDNVSIVDQTTRQTELHIREAWHIHNGIDLMNLAKDCSTLQGPCKGHWKVNQSPFLKTASRPHQLKQTRPILTQTLTEEIHPTTAHDHLADRTHGPTLPPTMEPAVPIHRQNLRTCTPK